MKRLLILFCSFFLSGCLATNPYKEFFHTVSYPYSPSHLVLLKKGEEPVVIKTDDIDENTLVAQSKSYVGLGYSSFNGPLGNRADLIQQAKDIGATHILLQEKHLSTQTHASAIAVPTIETTNHSGSVDGYRYSGTSTTTGTNYIPYSYTVTRYLQDAAYFVKSTKKSRIGVLVRDLTSRETREYERNTGAVVGVVLEDSPAFNANVLRGDLIIEIDGIPVKNGSHAKALFKAVPNNARKVTLKVLRRGKTLTFVL